MWPSTIKEPTIKQKFVFMAVLLYFYCSCAGGFSASFVNFHIAYVKFHIYVSTANTSFFSWHMLFVTIRILCNVRQLHYVNYVK